MSKLMQLPPMFEGETIDLETKEVLKELTKAHRYLAELKGYAEAGYLIVEKRGREKIYINQKLIDIVV